MDHFAKLWHGRALSLLTLLALCAGCAPPPPRDSHGADVRTITESEVLWVRHWSTRDAERIVAHYAGDATLMAPNLAPAIGREAIRETVKQFVRDGSFALTFEVSRVEVAKSGDFGYVQGTYTLVTTSLATGKPFTDQGTYLRVYRKQWDGAWKVLLDMRASSLTEASPLVGE
jgi:ketosteroid isomerase-like protein